MPQEPDREKQTPRHEKTPPKSIFATRWPIAILIAFGFLLVWYLSR